MQEDKLKKILSLIDEYISDKKSSHKWQPGKDWVSYSGPMYDSQEYVAAVESLLSEWIIFGKSCGEFEQKFPSVLGKKFGVLTNSGSSANLLMTYVLTAKNTLPEQYTLPKGSKFITPVVCFPTTINPLIQSGFEPVFVDVDIPSLNLNLDEVEKALEKDPSIKGIIFAHVLGNPPDMDRLMSIVEKYNLIFLEDACDAIGGTYKGRKLGSFGLMSTCSFFPAHHMTMGEGGFVASDIPIMRRALSSVRDWGRDCYCNVAKPGSVVCGTACGDRFKNWFKNKPEMTYDHRYVFSEIGFNLKPIDLQAAMGLKQIEKLPELDKARRNNFNELIKIFKPYEEYFYLPKATEGADPCWFGFLITLKDEAPFTKKELVDHFESNKIQTRSYFTGNCLYHPAYSDFYEKYKDVQFPNADKATKDTLFLGTFKGIDQDKIIYINEVLVKFMEKYKK